MRCVAMIPARGGSKRFPRKNIVEFFGHPIIAYSIRTATESHCFDKVFVSTDDDQIEEICKSYGASVDRRSPALGQDDATVAEVCLDFLERQDAEGATWDILCCLYATAALTIPDDVRAVVSLIDPDICEFAMGVSQADRYVYQALMSVGNGFLKRRSTDPVEKNMEVACPYWYSNGSVYAVWVTAFKKTGCFYGPNLKGHFMPRDRSVDLDRPEDLELAKFYYSKSGRKKNFANRRDS